MYINFNKNIIDKDLHSQKLKSAVLKVVWKFS